MRKFFVTVMFLFAGFAALCAVPESWTADYDTALKRAVKEKKPLLVLFTGSDWCPGCIALNKNTLSNEKFLDFVRKNLVLVYMDSPRGKPQTPQERAEVMKLYRKLDPGPYIPATVIVAGDGRILGRIAGYCDADEYIKQIKAFIK